MSVQINLNQPPFSFLSDEQRQWLSERLDLVFFAKGQTILEPGQQSPGLFIIFKGVVEESDGVPGNKHIYSQYGPDDIFDVRAILESGCKHHYQALEETLCYRLKADDFIQLLQQASDFSIYFNTDLGTQQQLVEKSEASGSEFILAKIDQHVVRKPVFVTAQTSLARVALMMAEQKQDALLVRDGARLGIVTGSDLIKATLIGDAEKHSRVGDIAQFDLIGVPDGDFLFSALLKMTQHQIERVVVRDGDNQVVGLLELMDMLSQFSTHSHMIALRIEQARNVKQLVAAAQRLEPLIASLHQQGVKADAIMALITTLNRRLIQRAFELIFPPKLQKNVCVLVLGSEGRGEQILKTDQDNAVILRDEHDREAVKPLLLQLHQALLDFGYPPCPGGVMFTSDSWLGSLAQWHERVERWLSQGNPQVMMNMAILFDGEAVCGDEQLLHELQQSWRQPSLCSPVSAAWFAKPALQFATPLTFLGKLRSDHGRIDIKKGAIFPLVHGVRSLAFEQKIDANSTLERLELLAQREILDEETAQGLKDSLLFFLQLRLRIQLERQSQHQKPDQNQPQNPHQNSEELINQGQQQEIEVDQLRSVERSMLRHALHRVKKFKQMLAHHFHLEAI